MWTVYLYFCVKQCKNNAPGRSVQCLPVISDEFLFFHLQLIKEVYLHQEISSD
jgi:hypothetical protein